MSETLLNNRYRLEAQQGSGGMAVIYRAIDQELGRTVAIKILRPSLTNDPDFLRRFKEEARNVANLSHPNIVTVYDARSDGKTHYIVMEFIDGSDLKKLIRKDGALPVDVALDLCIQICSGIGLAHRAGLVHADVKPQNVLLTSDRQVKVTDFGIAQAFNAAQPPTGNTEPLQIVWGSPHYFAPEQAQGRKPTPASDVYSIGVVMFEMLTGKLPYIGENQKELAMAHIQQPTPHLSEVAPHVPEALSRIIYQVMSKEPEQRYSPADKLERILLNYRDRGQQNTAVNIRAAGQPFADPSPAVPVPPPPPADHAPYRPPGQPQPERPLYYDPVPSSENSEPTQQYSIAPNAPAPPKTPAQPPAASVSAPYQQGVGDATRGDTGAYTGSSRPMNAFDLETSGFDAVTIILAVLALISVACLFPLYYLVYLAYR